MDPTKTDGVRKVNISKKFINLYFILFMFPGGQKDNS